MKRTFSTLKPSEERTPTRFSLTDEYATKAEETNRQNQTIYAHSLMNSPKKPSRARLNSLEATVLTPRRPFASFPQPIANRTDVLLEEPMSSEDQWTSVYKTSVDPVKYNQDEKQSYAETLRKWVQISWQGVLSLPHGTWIQYTTNVYPDYLTRKKTVCIIGSTLFNDPNTVLVWSIMAKDGKDHNEETHSGTETLCRRGQHLQTMNSHPNSALVNCVYCKCRGWRLTEGNQSQSRLFYASPWVVEREEKRKVFN